MFVLSAVSFIVSDIVCAYANKAMLTERLWKMGRNRFDTWSEFEGWFTKASGREMEQFVRNDGIDWDAK